MATILSEKKSSYGSPYAFYTVAVTQSSRTPTSVKIKVTCTAHLQYTSSYILTGNGYGLVAGIYVGGSWHNFTLKKTTESWRGNGKHSVSATLTISAKAAEGSLAGIKFRVNRSSGSNTACKLNATKCANISITNVSSSYNSIKISGAALSQAKVKASLSGLPITTGYETTINWYVGKTLVSTKKRSGTAKTTTAEYTHAGCLPNTIYELKAIMKYGNTSIATKNVNIATPQETGKLTLTPKSTYVSLKVSEMFNGPTYTRSIKIFYKKSSASEYLEYATLKSQESSVSTNITKLLSNQKYDFKAEVRNGKNILKTLTGTVTTTRDTSLIPTAEISNIVQKLGTRECTVAWFTDKTVAGTKYNIQAKDNGAWVTLMTLSSVASPVTVISPSGNTDVAFRITSSNSDVASGVTNVSDEYIFYVRDDFVWDVPKTAGTPMVITANEWNRLREYVYAKNANANISIVRQGDQITAAAYNQMKNDIAVFASINITDKRTGDQITAADIDALRIAVNE